MWQQTWHQIKTQFSKTDWQTLLPTIFIQLITWSYPPFAYLVGVAGTRFTSHFGPLFLYELCIGAAVTLALTNHFNAPLSLISLVLSVFLALVGFWNAPLLLALLILLPTFLIIVQLPQAGLQNGLGLATLGALLTLTIPVACAFNASHYLSWTVLSYFFPLAASTWFFLAPNFLRGSRQRDAILSGAALLLVLSLLTRPLGVATLLPLTLTALSWFYLIRPHQNPPRFIYLNLTQLVLVVLVYWT